MKAADHFLNTIRHKKIPHEKVCGFGFPFKGGCLLQVKRTNKDRHGTAKEWPQLLNRGGHLIQVKTAVFVWAKIWDFENWLLTRGWPPNTGLLYIGLIVF